MSFLADVLVSFVGNYDILLGFSILYLTKQNKMERFRDSIRRAAYKLFRSHFSLGTCNLNNFAYRISAMFRIRMVAMLQTSLTKEIQILFYNEI